MLLCFQGSVWILMVIAGILFDDVFEQILVRLDVKDLIRSKRVCRSWYSLISSYYFVQLQLNYSLNDDHLKLHGHRRIARLPNSLYEEDNYYHYIRDWSSIVGSSNGLVCQIYFRQLCCVVTNPLTAQFKKVPLPCYLHKYCFAFGFGYDPCIDDYKVIAAVVQSNRHPDRSAGVPTGFYAFTLNAPSAAWRFVGQVNYWYTYSGRSGVLCDGALHWFMRSCQDDRKVILSLDLSTEEFKEIPLPKFDDKYERSPYHRLGIFQGCLCIYSNYQSSFSNKWFYNKQHSWELFSCDNEIQNVVHYLRSPGDRCPSSLILKDDERCFSMCVSTSWDYIRAPIFVPSLVSPHDNNNIMGRSTLVSPHVGVLGDAPTTKNKVNRRISSDEDGLKGVLLGWLRRCLQWGKIRKSPEEEFLFDLV